MQIAFLWARGTNADDQLTANFSDLASTAPRKALMIIEEHSPDTTPGSEDLNNWMTRQD